MRQFSTDAAGFAALTLSELILQHAVLSGLVAPEEARRLLDIAAQRHESSAVGSEEKIALNMEAAHLLRVLAHGLEPLFAAREAAAPVREEAARSAPSTGAKSAVPSRPIPTRPRLNLQAVPDPADGEERPRDLWIRFPD